MTVHRFHNDRIFTWREHKPPIARGHRSWLRDGIEARSGETRRGSIPKGRKPGGEATRPKGVA
jgi:hypothetical protein